VTSVFQTPAHLFDLAKDRGRARRGPAPLDASEPGAADVAADLELDLEEWMTFLLGSSGSADRGGQDGGALPYLFGQPLLLRPVSGVLGLPRLLLATLGLALLAHS
jgi:hypothetical protein